MDKLIKSGALAILLMLATVTLVYAFPVLWGAFNNPIYDQTGVGGTVLADGDIVQLIWDQGNDGIDPPDSLGAPNGDDQLLASSAIGVGTFFPGTGIFTAPDLPPNPLVIDDKIYVRAWNAGTFAAATHYGDSIVATVAGPIGFDFDATAASSFATTIAKPPPLGVTLDSLSATCLDGSIVVEWATFSELQTLGFNLLRSKDPLGESSQINTQLIPAMYPGGTTGGSYEFVDDDISANTAYYYWLVEVEFSGASSLYGPAIAPCTITPTAVSVVEFSAVSTLLRDRIWLWALLLIVPAGLLVGYAAQRNRKRLAQRP